MYLGDFMGYFSMVVIMVVVGFMLLERVDFVGLIFWFVVFILFLCIVGSVLVMYIVYKRNVELE